VIIKKPSGNGYRFVVDLRQLNARTKPFQYHLPEPEDCVDKLKGAKWLSVIDIEKAFWNLALHKNSRHKTAFKCVFGTFEYCVAPMGLLTSAAWWQRFIEQKLSRHGILHRLVHPDMEPIKDSYTDSDGNKCVGMVCVYLDDIVIFSQSAEQHMKDIEKVFRVLSQENLYLAPEKSNLFCEYIQYLGVWVGQGKVYMSADKVRAILKMPLPNQSQTQIRGFIGMASFYRRFISGFSTMVTPLAELLKKGVDVPSEWKPKHTEAVNKLKTALTTYPVLRQYDCNKPLFLVTDASDHSIGSCLY
jgi:hypothetical protein